MSIETLIQANTEALVNMTRALLDNASMVNNPTPVAPSVASPPVAAPVVAPPTPPEVIPTAQEAPPVVSTPPATSPFTSMNDVIQYIMGKYQQLGPQKGAMIQTVINNLGYQNVNDVPAEKWNDLHAGVEAIQ